MRRTLTDSSSSSRSLIPRTTCSSPSLLVQHSTGSGRSSSCSSSWRSHSHGRPTPSASCTCSCRSLPASSSAPRHSNSSTTRIASGGPMAEPYNPYAPNQQSVNQRHRQQTTIRDFSNNQELHSGSILDDARIDPGGG